MFNALFSSIVAICGLLSGVVGIILNNKYNLKIIELNNSRETASEVIWNLTSVYEEYFRLTAECIYSNSEESLISYKKHFPIAIIYFPPNAIEIINNIDELIDDKEFEKAKAALVNFAYWMSRLMKDMPMMR